jgi:hypothetical protein
MAVQRAGPFRRLTVAWAGQETDILMPWDSPPVGLGDDIQFDVSEARLFPEEPGTAAVAPPVVTPAWQTMFAG